MQWWTLTQLKSRKASTRAAAAGKLGRTGGGSTALERLSEASGDTEALVRKSAAEALGKLGSEEALPILRTRIHDPEPEVRLAVVKSLQELRSPNGIALLVFALG